MKTFEIFQKRVGGKIDKREEKGSSRRRSDRDEEGGSGPKPSGQVSLFAFLEDKLPVHSGRFTSRPQKGIVLNIFQFWLLHGLLPLLSFISFLSAVKSFSKMENKRRLRNFLFIKTIEFKAKFQ